LPNVTAGEEPSPGEGPPTKNILGEGEGVGTGVLTYEGGGGKAFGGKLGGGKTASELKRKRWGNSPNSGWGGGLLPGGGGRSTKGRLLRGSIEGTVRHK